MSEELEELALFPLNMVLFPGMVHGLHIFEDRYKLMINVCIQQGRPFGIVLNRTTMDPAQPSRPHKVGTTAHIVQVERLEDGRMNILIIGRTRFRTLEILQEQPYFVVRAEEYPLLSGETEIAMSLAEEVRTRLPRYVEWLGQAASLELKIADLPEDPTLVAYLTAIALQVPVEDKQNLLAQATVPGMLRDEVYLLRREDMLLQHFVKIYQTRSEHWGLMPGRTQFFSEN